jgi:EAL and modified HD-GYP domain-containing signal transduction protein
MRTILSRLELSTEVRNALVSRVGPLGVPLQLVESYERANWEAARDLAIDTDVPEDAIPVIYMDALKWASLQIAG